MIFLNDDNRTATLTPDEFTLLILGEKWYSSLLERLVLAFVFINVNSWYLSVNTIRNICFSQYFLLPLYDQK